MKKFVPLTLAALLILGATTAFGDSVENSDPNVGANNDEMLLEYDTTDDGIMMIDGDDMLLDFGINAEEGTMMIDGDDATLGMPVRELGYFDMAPVEMGENGEYSILTGDSMDNFLQLNCNANTLIIDAMTGETLTTADLADATSAYVYMGMQQTMSLPPQRFAEAIIVNMAQDAAAPMLLDITNIMTQGTAVTFGTSDAEVSFTLDADMPLEVFASDELTTVGDVSSTSRLLVWNDMNGDVYEVMEIQAIPFAVNGMAIDTEVVDVNGAAFVALRDVAKALDLTLTWNGAEKTATISNDMRTMDFTAGLDLYVSTAVAEDMMGMTAPESLGAAPFIGESGTLMVPAMALNNFVGLDVVVK